MKRRFIPLIITALLYLCAFPASAATPPSTTTPSVPAGAVSFGAEPQTPPQQQT
ncbi:MAG: hypothetical protein HYT94_04990, partial [Parcubacteria group bacterium]|nr:hypothetical protein [Parcubacteria group bacterium]